MDFVQGWPCGCHRAGRLSQCAHSYIGERVPRGTAHVGSLRLESRVWVRPVLFAQRSIVLSKGNSALSLNFDGGHDIKCFFEVVRSAVEDAVADDGCVSDLSAGATI